MPTTSWVMGSDLGSKPPLLRLASGLRKIWFLLPFTLVVAVLYYGLFALHLDKTPPSHLDADPPVVQGGSSLPGKNDVTVLVLARSGSAKALNSTLASLLSTRGLRRQSVIISPDSLASREVEEAIRTWSIPYSPLATLATTYSDQCSHKIRKLRGKRNEKSEHYCLALCHAFAQPGTASVIVVEDDLCFAPDFLEFFSSMAPALQVDPSLSFISAWNENGFNDLVADPVALRRTDFFSGVAFLLLRKQWNSMRPQWPMDRDWVSWVQEMQQKQREHPAVTADQAGSFHTGKKSYQPPFTLPPHPSTPSPLPLLSFPHAGCDMCRWLRL
jgi:hypothetical protein